MQYTEQAGLPRPDDLSAEHSRQVAASIIARIRQAGGSIGFAEYMQAALYEPGLGYYAAGASKFGADGDFVTAPEISSVFGRVLARQVAEVLRKLDGGSVLEFGAGSGKLAVDLLLALEALDALPQHYLILEVSADLQQRQQQRLQREVPQHADRVRWLSDLPSAHSGVIIANEVLDAMPVERFTCSKNGVLQQRVEVTAGGLGFTAVAAPPQLAAAVSAIEQDLGAPLAAGYTSEVSLGAAPWIADIAAMLEQGVVFLIDYGCSRREYYATDRADGWLRCHFRHHAHDNPLILPGVQDITAWVDFTAVAAAAVDAGLTVAGYQSQAMFLAGGGLQQELQGLTELAPEQQLALSAQVKTLTLPGEMGEKFKCMALSRGIAAAPSAFMLGDRTHTL
ncbi:MAG: SAM-dependent methyltransferase [Woeseiaceae bacterium]